jgi:tripartite-type tricarboxylate transporter receptor subunit TctC
MHKTAFTAAAALAAWQPPPPHCTLGPALACRAVRPTVRFVLPNATGSGVDAITRAAQSALGKALGATVVVDNQPGAGGVVGLQTLAKRRTGRPHPVGGVQQRGDLPQRDEVPAVRHAGRLHADRDGAASTPMVLVVNPQKVAATNSREFIALLKSKPDELNFGSGGTGTILHLAAEMFLDEAKVPRPATSPTRASARW